MQRGQGTYPTSQGVGWMFLVCFQLASEEQMTKMERLWPLRGCCGGLDEEAG